MFRLVTDPEELRAAVTRAALAHRVEAREVLFNPAVRLAALDGIPTTVVAFTTDIPAFDGAWGQPFLLGPGSIHVAHTPDERIAKRELLEAVELYVRLAKLLVAL